MPLEATGPSVLCGASRDVKSYAWNNYHNVVRPVNLCGEHFLAAWLDAHEHAAMLLGWCDTCEWGPADKVCRCGKPYESGPA
jgi:hypothetical protein